MNENLGKEPLPYKRCPFRVHKDPGSAPAIFDPCYKDECAMWREMDALAPQAESFRELGTGIIMPTLAYKVGYCGLAGKP